MTTTTPKPTAAEHDLALHNARALGRPVAEHAVPHDPIRVMLATTLLDIHAKLAESEASLQRAIADTIAEMRRKKSEVELGRVRADLAAQARARRVPTRDELVRVIRDELRQPVPASDNRTASEACADAVLRLFAEADAAKSPVTGNEPPSPLPEVLPAGTRVLMDDSEAYEELRLGINASVYFGQRAKNGVRLWPGDVCAVKDIDWSHYRAQQRAAATPATEPPCGGLTGAQLGAAAEPELAIPTPDPEPDSAWLKRTVEELTTARPVEMHKESDGDGWSVSSPGQEPFRLNAYVHERNVAGIHRILSASGWPLRRNCITEPTPKAPEHTVLVPERLEALTARVEELELQARVMRRWANSSIPAPVWDRIEREERERAK